MNSRVIPLTVLLALATGLAGCEQGGQQQPPPVQTPKVSYAEDVAPILQKHCAECHLPGMTGAVETGFQIDSYASLMKGSQYGPVIEPGLARTSSLFILLTGKDHLTVNMPHGREPLSELEIETIRVWIDQGALDN